MLQDIILPAQRMQAEISATGCMFSNAFKPVPATRVCAIVPVRNEAKCLAKTLDALRQQIDIDGFPLDPDLYEVLVLVNNCTDKSYQIAINYANRFPCFRLIVENVSLPDHVAHIGTVRRMLMDGAYNRLISHGNNAGIIASTDGDTIVDSQWIYHIMNEIDAGNDAVGGRILTEKGAGKARLYHLRDVTYRCLLTQAESLIDPQNHDPFPCHFQYFGANMAVTCKMYIQAGRLPQLPFLEDMAFHKALLFQDARIRRSFKVKVYTSARMSGRVRIGFSEQLKKWRDEGKANKPQMVEHVNYLLNIFSVRSQLRKCWNDYTGMQIIRQTEMNMIAARLGVKSEWLFTELINSNYFGKFWDTVHQDSNLTKDIVHQPVNQAIEQLRHFLKNSETIVFQTNPDDKFQHAD